MPRGVLIMPRGMIDRRPWTGAYGASLLARLTVSASCCKQNPRHHTYLHTCLSVPIDTSTDMAMRSTILRMRAAPIPPPPSPLTPCQGPGRHWSIQGLPYSTPKSVGFSFLSLFKGITSLTSMRRSSNCSRPQFSTAPPSPGMAMKSSFFSGNSMPV